jgi:hypothetical protein
MRNLVEPGQQPCHAPGIEAALRFGGKANDGLFAISRFRQPMAVASRSSLATLAIWST